MSCCSLTKLLFGSGLFQTAGDTAPDPPDAGSDNGEDGGAASQSCITATILIVAVLITYVLAKYQKKVKRCNEKSALLGLVCAIVGFIIVVVIVVVLLAFTVLVSIYICGGSSPLGRNDPAA